jgi:hypothetical protein
MTRGIGHPFHVCFPPEEPIAGDTQNEKYLRALEQIGLARLAETPHLTMHSDPMVSRRAPEREDLFGYYRGYWVKRTASALDKKRALERAAEHFGLSIVVSVGYTASEVEAALHELAR